jgi:hypothetical protein
LPQSKNPPANVDLASPAAVKQFQIATKKSTHRATRTKRAAVETLIAEGIYTAKGKLTKNYR